MKKTVINEMFGIEYPIVQAGMAWVSRAELAAAAAQAGILGLLGAATMGAEEMAKEVSKVRTLTDKPFGVNISLLSPNFEDVAAAALEQGVRVFFVSAGSPRRITGMLKDAGAKVVHVCPSPGLAAKAEAAGVDAVVVEGFEAGGHDGVDELTTLTIVPMTKDVVKVPVIAAGGISDGRTMAAAFALGADGVQVGTRFVASAENNAPEVYKKMLIEAGENGTVFISHGYQPVRVLRTPFALKLHEMEKSGARGEDLRGEIGPGRGFKACMEGDVEQGMFNAGTGAGLIRDIKPVKEIVMDMVKGYEEAVRGL